MNRQLTITTEPIDEAALLSKRQMSAGMGAVVYFLGVVRGTEDDRAITAIEYEAFLELSALNFELGIRSVARAHFSPATGPLKSFDPARNFL